jgi:Nickel responsive protein SCO4226-like
MPRYLIVRRFDVTENEMPEVGRRSNRAIEQVPGVVWEHSHVIVGEDGRVKTYCVYTAPDKDAVQRHAGLLGQHLVDEIEEIAGDVTPADFPI